LGCDRHYPGKNIPVELRVDDYLARYTYENGKTAKDAIETGAHIWDCTGANFSVNNPPDGGILDLSVVSSLGGKYLGLYKSMEGKIYFDVNALNLSYDGLAMLAAHEIGHSFGLEHVKDNKSIMYPGPLFVRNSPSSIDLQEYVVYWNYENTCPIDSLEETNNEHSQ
jgi:hypothetical protein